jgi:hypothetical protein
MGPLRTLKLNSVSGLVKTHQLALCFGVTNELHSDVIELMFERLIYAELGQDDWGPGRPAFRSTCTLCSP